MAPNVQLNVLLVVEAPMDQPGALMEAGAAMEVVGAVVDENVPTLGLNFEATRHFSKCWHLLCIDHV